MGATSYIGLACTAHDPAIAIVDARGDVVFAEATERALQSKRAFHTPPDPLGVIGDLLDRHTDGDVVVATTWAAGPWRRRLFRAYARLIDARGFRHPHRELEWAFIKSVLVGTMDQLDRAAMNLEYALRERRPGARLVRRAFDHHTTHAATACLTSPFDEAVCVILDGYGEGASTAMFRYADGALTPLGGAGRSAGASPGIFYARLCRACGFDPVLGEEWKVMGLAAYGRRDVRFEALLRDTITVAGLGFAQRPRMHDAWAELYALTPTLDASARADLAHTGQLVFSELVLELLGHLHARGLSKNLVLGGGCALNSSLNGRLHTSTGFERVHVPSAPADDGNALGAALLACFEDHPARARPRTSPMSPYLGSTLDAEALDRAEALGGLVDVRPRDVPVEAHAARLLAEGRILGWAQGRAELGPRALGHRSILADPRNPKIKDLINGRVKFREEFRPFAPSILEEYGPEYFEDYQPSPYMERTLVFRPEVRAKVPGVVHEDGTGRLQSVRRDWSPSYHALIEHFRVLTGVPLVLNTSFNVMGKPIIHTVEDALAVFHTTGLDALVLEDRVYEKRRH